MPVILIFFLLFTGAYAHERTRYIMGIPVTVISDDRSIHRKVFKVFSQIDGYFSLYRKDSLLCRLNTEKSLYMDRLFNELLQISFEVYRETGGYFDISLGNHTVRYGDSHEMCPLPENESTGMENIKVKGNLIVLENGISLDFGGIGKGFAVDKAGALFRNSGVYGVIKADSEVRCFGGCRVIIENPYGSGFFAVFETTGKETGISTGGIYRRYKNSIDNNHLINPFTGVSADKIVLISVFGDMPNSYLDGYSTAGAVMPVEKAVEFLNRKRLGFFILLRKGCYLAGRYNHLYIKKLQINPQFPECKEYKPEEDKNNSQDK
ncbi:FAD:protein FMN transferase [Persephonella sp.]